jgi:hypothetical protein
MMTFPHICFKIEWRKHMRSEPEIDSSYYTYAGVDVASAEQQVI